jgi:hypothetical protein
MVGISRHAGTGVAPDAARLVGSVVESSMTISAQASQWAEPEGVKIVFVRWVMVGDGGRRTAALIETSPAQWLKSELMPATTQPARRFVPAMNFGARRHVALRSPSSLQALFDDAPFQRTENPPSVDSFVPA